MMHRWKLLTVACSVAILGGVIGILAYQQENRKPYDVAIDATKDTTDMSGTMYRVRVTNVGTQELTGIVVELGPGDVRNKQTLQPGEDYFFYPKPDTVVDKVKVTTNEGVDAVQDYRSPMKTFGLPGSGR